MQIKLFQLGFGKKTVDNFSRELAGNPMQTALAGEDMNILRSDIIWYVRLGEWEGGLQICARNYIPSQGHFC